jgi:hypothetical protein
MRIHKNKYEKVISLLREGKSPKEIARQLKLNVRQILEVAEIEGFYVDLKKLKKELEEELKERRKELKKLEEIA